MTPPFLRGVHEEHDSASANGGGFNKVVLTSEKMAVLAPIPRADATTPAMVKLGVCQKIRREWAGLAETIPSTPIPRRAGRLVPKEPVI